MPESPPPETVIREALRLTRLARRAPETTDETSTGAEETLSSAASYRQAREELLEPYGFTARTRTDADSVTLVCYPDEWVSAGTVDLAAVEDTDRAIERQIEGTGTDDEWDAVADHNTQIAEQVAKRYGSPHAETAAAFGTFMANHRVRRIETATAADIREFVTDYFPRNCWPSSDQRSVVNQSVRLSLETARNR